MIGISYFFFLVISLIIWIIYRVVVYKKNHRINILREVFINIFFLYFLIVIYLTFFKGSILHLDLQMRTYSNLIPLIETINMFQDNFMGIGNAFYNVIGNILLFVPLGFGIPLFFKNHNKLSKVTFYGFLASFSIELLQYLTCTNLTDVDDIIFNTLGTIIGFLIFNIFISIIEKTKLINLIDKIRINYKGNLVFLSLKFLLPITLCTIALCFGILYNFTVSGMLSDEEISKAVFTYNTDGEYMATEQFFDKKLFLQVNDDYLELKTADEVLNNRWVQGYSTQVQWNDSLYGYSIAIIEDDNDINNKGVVVFGKNKDAKTLKITFNNNVYTTFISPDEFFIITYPTFETLDENTTIYDIYSTGKSKDLKITFNEDDNIICNHMKFFR